MVEMGKGVYRFETAGFQVSIREEKAMYWTIDRYEGALAVCQNDQKQMRNVPRDRLPPGLKEGDLVVEEGGRYRFDGVETAKRRQAVRDSAEGLWM